jgi:arylformamidase
MRLTDYPPQEPLSALGRAYSDSVMAMFPDAPVEQVAYGADPYQGLLIFPSAQPDGRVLLAFHGGGWTSGYKEWMGFMAPALTRAGITFVSAGYRLAPGHLFPVGFDDCCAAMARCSREVTRFGGDPGCIYVGGHSAGGHYAALMAVRRDWQQPHGLAQDAVRGCLPMSGVYTFSEGSGLSVRPRFLGPADAPDADAVTARASPLHNIQEVPPPFLMSCGALDFPHLIPQAEAMRTALQAAGGNASVLTIPACDHFSAHVSAADPHGLWARQAVAFMAAR